MSPLVGKMVNVARNMGLGRDNGRRKSAKGNGRGREREREDMRGMVCGMFCFMTCRSLVFFSWQNLSIGYRFTSDILGQPALAPSFTYTIRLPECASTEEDEESEHNSHGGDDDTESVCFD